MWETLTFATEVGEDCELRKVLVGLRQEEGLDMNFWFPKLLGATHFLSHAPFHLHFWEICTKVLSFMSIKG